MIKKLYVIGNGFDIHHGINSSYISLREYCRVNDEELYMRLEKYYGDCDLLWANFEIGLSELNPNYIMDFAKVGHDDWNTSWKGIYAFIDEVRNEVDYLQISLKRAFAEWVEQLEKGDRESRLFFIWDDALFLSFNYTHTLERLYGIPQNKICYIHGRATNQFSQLIFGHSCNENEIEAKILDNNVLEEEAVKEIVRLLMDLRKDSYTIIQQNNDFFDTLKNIEDVYILGHSLSIVDDLYFEKIKEVVPITSNWIVSWHSDADKANIDRLQNKLNLPFSQYKPIKLKDLGNEFYPAIKFNN